MSLGRAPRECEFALLLPYSEEIKNEARESFQHILCALDEAVSKRSLTAVATAAKWLLAHIELHNFSFSLEDQVRLIELFYTLLPSEHSVRAVVVSVLSELLQERYLRHEDLTAAGIVLELDWHILHDVTHNELYAKFRGPHGIASNKLVKLIALARRFFSPTSTQEIAALLFPKLTMFTTGDEEEFLLSRFLPTGRQSRAAQGPGYLAWLPDVLEICDWGNTHPGMLQLLARVASSNIGHVSWDALYPRLFTQYLRLLDVPVGTTSGKRSHPNDHDTEGLMDSMGKMVVAMIGPDGKALTHLAELLTAVQSFFHPSNLGEWTDRIVAFVQALCSHYLLRLFDEREGNIIIAEQLRLTPALTERFVGLLIDPLVYVIHSKKQALMQRGINALRNLMFVAPAQVAPPLLSNITSTLETAVDVQQVGGALGAIVGISLPLFDTANYQGGLEHFTSLFSFTLPLLDINSPLKALAGLHVATYLVNLVPLVDCSASPKPDGLDESLTKAWDNTQFVEDLVLQCADRLLALLEVQLNSQFLDLTMTGSLQRLAYGIRQMSSHSLLDRVWEKISAWLADHIQPTAVKAVSYIVLLFVSDNATRAIPFVRDLCNKIIADAAGQPLVEDPNADENHVPGHIVWHLGLLNTVVKRTAHVLLPIAPLLLDMLDKTLFLASKAAAKLAGKVYRHLLRALTEYYQLHNNTDVTPDTFATFIRDGALSSTFTTRPAPQHIPAPAEIEFAEALLARYYSSSLAYVHDVAAGTSAQWPTLLEVNKRLVLRSHLCVLRNSIRSPALFPEEDLPAWKSTHVEEDDADESMQTNLTLFALHNGFPASSRAAAARRGELFEVVHAAIDHLLATREDDIKALGTLAKIADVMLSFRGFRERVLVSLSRDYLNFKAILGHPYAAHRHSKATAVYRMGLLHYQRQAAMLRHLPRHHHHLQLVLDLYRLSTAHYPRLRGKAQGLLRRALKYHSLFRREVFDRALADLQRAKSLAPTVSASDPASGPATDAVGPESTSATIAPMDGVVGGGAVIDEAAHMAVDSTLDATTSSAAQGSVAHSAAATGVDVTQDLNKDSSASATATHHPHHHHHHSRHSHARHGDNAKGNGADVGPLERNTLKGVLHVLSDSFVVRVHKRDLIRRLAKALADLSELRDKKIQTLVGGAFKEILKCLPTHFEPAESALALPVFEALVALHPIAETYRARFTTEALQFRLKRDESIAEQHSTLVKALVGLCHSLQSHWFYELMMASMLDLLSSNIDSDALLEYYLRGVTNVQLAQLSIQHVLLMLRRFRAPIPRTVTHPPSRPATVTGFLLGAGVRPDNQDLLDHVAAAGLSSHQMANIAFADKTQYGWSPVLEWGAFVPSAQRGSIANAAHVAIVRATLTPDWLAALIAREGASLGTTASLTFSTTIAKLYTKLFRLGPDVFALFRSQMELLTGPGSTPPQHRCASEMVAGVVRGSRHWPATDIEALWDWLLPFLTHAWALITSETRNTWLLSMQHATRNQDPRRLIRLTKLVLDAVLESVPSDTSGPASSSSKDVTDGAVTEAPASLVTAVASALVAMDGVESAADAGAVTEAGRKAAAGAGTGPGAGGAGSGTRLDAPSVLALRLRLLSTIVSAFMWKGTYLSAMLLARVQPHVGQEYKLVRVALAELMCACCRNLATTPSSKLPSSAVCEQAQAAFLTQITDALTLATLVDVPTEQLNRIKTLLCLLPAYFRCYDPTSLPLLIVRLVGALLAFPAESTTDPDFQELLVPALATAAQLEFFANYPALFDACIAATRASTWHVKMRVVTFSQVSIFSNLFFTPKARILDLFQPLLTDEHLEVRNSASVSLSGLVRCGLVDAGPLATLLATWAGAPLKAKRGMLGAMTADDRASLLRRHAGVLGLRALVEAFPYSIPTWMPDVLVKFCLHVSDVDPIGATVRAGMSEFWRTHRECWDSSKELFTEAQLDAVTNTLISPSYFA